MPEGNGSINSIEKLNEFLSAELSAVQTYREAIDRVRDDIVKEQLEELELSHRHRVQALQSRLTELGADASPEDLPWGMWSDFSALLDAGPPADRAAVAALEEGEDRGLREYRNALDCLDSDLKNLVEQSLLPAQERAHDSLSLLKETLH